RRKSAAWTRKDSARSCVGGIVEGAQSVAGCSPLLTPGTRRRCAFIDERRLEVDGHERARGIFGPIEKCRRACKNTNGAHLPAAQWATALPSPTPFTESAGVVFPCVGGLASCSECKLASIQLRTRLASAIRVYLPNEFSKIMTMGRFSTRAVITRHRPASDV